MRAKELVPRLCGLGARVYYTHRATGVQGGSLRDVGRSEHHDVQVLLYGKPRYDGHNVAPHVVPHSGGHAKALHRWVVAWPQAGYGTVVGLTYRASGWTVPGSGGGYDPDGDPPYFQEYERYPVYQVKTALRGKPLLVPLWACIPLPPNEVSTTIQWPGDAPPQLLSDTLNWEGWCAWWCGAAAKAVAA